jgi:hypothetical protein
MFRRTGRPDARTSKSFPVPFRAPTQGPRRPERHQHREKGGGGGRCLADAGGGRDTDARQQKSEKEDATSNLLLKPLEATLATYI